VEHEQHRDGDSGSRSGLIVKPYERWTTEDSNAVVDIYKVLVDMADKVSQRRQAANSFYLSVNTAIIGASAYITAVRADWTSTAVISLAGVAISILWARNIVSYRTLNAAKFKVINEIETTLPIAAYTTEWKYLDPDRDGIRHKPFHEVEIAVPWVFVLVHFVQAARAAPWDWLVSLLPRIC
jgi:hypothetical protein